METTDYETTEEEATLLVVQEKSAAATVQLLLNACGGDCALAQKFFRQWRRGPKMNDPDIHHLITSVERLLKSIETQRSHAKKYSSEWWKPPV